MTDTSNCALQLRDLRKSFGNTSIIRGVSLDIVKTTEMSAV